MNYLEKVKLSRKVKKELETESDVYINSNYFTSAKMLRNRILEIEPSYYDKSDKNKIPTIFYFTAFLSLLFYLMASLSTSNWLLPYQSPYFWVAIILEIPRSIYVFKRKNDN